MTINGLLTRQDAARELRLSLSTIDRLIKAGKLRVVRLPTPKGRGTIRITREALEELAKG